MTPPSSHLPTKSSCSTIDRIPLCSNSASLSTRAVAICTKPRSLHGCACIKLVRKASEETLQCAQRENIATLSHLCSSCFSPVFPSADGRILSLMGPPLLRSAELGPSDHPSR
ncbi:hypothetical protein RvY_19104 [Ramazzottius varieornatus]|uniref:Uncharacterized protein n=1 Tax=Ramazzottius varieornatus TaxID=947166 RepID=A0A1D1WAJ5_RAMVA|nr:hypothetical protein RvY_19104 [Ramazzottius varieornatus]